MYDVAIIGGGPAGSTAATLLARAGRRVIVLEREKFPRFHIGESLLPFSMQTFDRLGVREKLDRTFLPKFGGEIVAACGSKGVKFYFKDGFRSRRDRAYQVTRSEFDKLLLDHSRENGAEVREETDVKNIAFENDRAKIDNRSSLSARLQRPASDARQLFQIQKNVRSSGQIFRLRPLRKCRSSRRNRRHAYPHGAQPRPLVLDDPPNDHAHEHRRCDGHSHISRDETFAGSGT